MKSISILLGMFIMPAMVYLQESVKIGGVIYDRETKIPLANCHIYVDGTNVGTVSDENGAFSLRIPVKHYYNSIMVSHVGFVTLEQKLALVKHRGLKILMDYDVVVLEDLVIRPESAEVLDETIDELISWYDNQDDMLSEVYTRLIQIDEGQEILIDVLADKGMTVAKEN